MTNRSKLDTDLTRAIPTLYLFQHIPIHTHTHVHAHVSLVLLISSLLFNNGRTGF